MLHKNNCTLIILFILVGLYACNKSKDELPPLTTTGAHFLACKVDGQNHIYSGISNVFNPDGVAYQVVSTGEIALLASNSVHDDFIMLTIHNPSMQTVDTIYWLSNSINGNKAERYTGNAGRPYLTMKNSGWVKFARLDSSVASGTFAFTAYRNGDSTVVTEGRFDLENK